MIEVLRRKKYSDLWNGDYPKGFNPKGYLDLWGKVLPGIAYLEDDPIINLLKYLLLIGVLLGIGYLIYIFSYVILFLLGICFIVLCLASACS